LKISESEPEKMPKVQGGSAGIKPDPKPSVVTEQY
jgi:hypothetical protein